MATFAQTQGLPVWALAERKQIGKVDGLVVDPERMRVGWLSVNSKGAFDGRHWIPAEAISRIGTQAVFIRSENDIRGPRFVAPEETVAHVERLVADGPRVMGNQIVTTEGQKLGRVVNYEFSPKGLELTQLVLDKADKLAGQQVVKSVHVQTVKRNEIVVVPAAHYSGLR